jgi:hypothetical protein
MHYFLINKQVTTGDDADVGIELLKEKLKERENNESSDSPQKTSVYQLLPPALSLALRFAEMETALGEVDRGRHIYASTLRRYFCFSIKFCYYFFFLKKEQFLRILFMRLCGKNGLLLK